MKFDRISTSLILVASLFFYFVIMPKQIEAVDYGRIIPSTVPSFAVWVVIIAATIQLFTDKIETSLNVSTVIRTVLFLGLIAFGVYLMPIVGFEFVSPVLALLVMLLIREKRWYWILTGSIVIPIGTWLIVEQLLGRTLP